MEKLVAKTCNISSKVECIARTRLNVVRILNSTNSKFEKVGHIMLFGIL